MIQLYITPLYFFMKDILDVTLSIPQG